MLPSNLPEFIATKRFEYRTIEPLLSEYWNTQKIYKTDPLQWDQAKLIDTPPPYANGRLHHGHSMSYSQLDIMARYFRMRQPTILPLAFDDNGLPTERFTELKYGIQPGHHPPDFFELCKIEAGHAIENQRRQFDRMGFSYDHQIAYRTIDDGSIRETQLDFINLYNRGALGYNLEPQLHCPHCRTALAQADIAVISQESAYYYISFGDFDEEEIIIATTRPELIPAAMAIFIHPTDPLASKIEQGIKAKLRNPITGNLIPILLDDRIDISKGTSRMMCASFGDTMDIDLYREYGLSAIIIIGADGKMNSESGPYTGLTSLQARSLIICDLEESGYLRGSRSMDHDIPSCDRCESPIEIIMSRQWSILLLNIKQELLEFIKPLSIHPSHMKKRIIHWIEGLKWDWIISRQRYYGISIPAWICYSCDTIETASKEQLPLRTGSMKPYPCTCGGLMEPDGDIFDTWMTSSLTPRILNRLYERDANSPLAFRSQAHEIIRTWAFYSIIKQYYGGNGTLPWNNLLISGWGLGFKSKGKRGIKASKSSGSGHNPLTLIEEYGADALRYWAASARLGKDQYLSEALLNRGKKIGTKLYNATKICLMLADQGSIVSDIQMDGKALELIETYEFHMSQFEYSQALKLIEDKFWNTFCAISIEETKQRRDEGSLSHTDAKRLLIQMIMYLRFFAPFMPFITEYLYLTIRKLQIGTGQGYSSLKPESIHIQFTESQDLLKQ